MIWGAMPPKAMAGLDRNEGQALICGREARNAT
jgi:hypothetical protein